MRSITPAFLAALALPVWSTAPRAAQPPRAAAAQDDLRALEGLVDGALAALDAGGDTPIGVREVWQRAAALRDRARDVASAGLDNVLDARILALAQAAPVSSGPSGVARALFLAAARLPGADADAKALADVLDPLLDSSREEVATAAAGLLSDAQFRTLERERRESALEHLRRVAQDAVRAPALRLEAAYALFELGWGPEKRAARDTMSDFLASTDSDLRAQGALALARTGAEVSGPLFDELRRLARTPDENGRLAQTYLEIEDVRREANRKVKRAQELYESGAGAKPAPAPQGEFDQLDAVVGMIERYHLVGDKVQHEDLLDAALDGMLRSLDEHSTYLSPKAYARFEQDLEAGYGGIGAYVGEDRDDGLFTITHPIYSGPAYRAGLLSDDKIVRIDDWPTIGKATDDIIKRLKGRPGTSVKLYVWRRGMDPGLIDRPSEDMAMQIERATISIPSVQSQMLPGGIAMVALREFSRVASSDLRQSLESMLQAGARAVVLDLRGNNGGLLDEAVNVASLFLPKGSLVVSTESRVAPDERLATQAPPLVPPDMPVAVLVNRFSASAAEIVSGALQDHHRAALIGKRTFGKGSVQNLLRVSGTYDDEYTDENKNGRHDNWERITKDYDGNGEFDYAPRLKMTIARYRLPSGRSIHRETDAEGNELSKGGVDPDVDIESRRLGAWRIQELSGLQRDHAARRYVDDLIAQNRERKDWLQGRLAEIAENDRKDIGLYPGFEEFYQSLDTPLARDDVRQLLRAEIRRRVQDARGQEFPPGDFVEDLQLQAAIHILLEKLGVSPAEVPQYSTIPSETLGRGPLVAVGGASLIDALDQIRQARSGDGKLPEETLKKLADWLERRRSDGDE